MTHLLFIDDEEGVRRSIKRALKREPYTIATAESGEAGIAMVAEDRLAYATVISDFRMPGMDGLETLTEIGRLNPETTRVILTGYATMEAAIQATNRGIDGFLTKPFDNVQLRASLRDISIRKRLRQFVPEQVYVEIRNSPGAIEPRFNEASVLFSDIRGFTRMSQHVPPETIATFLNDMYFTPMGEIAYAHGGTVDKHIGDSIMVVFGTPVPREDDPQRAVNAAVAMQRKALEIDGMLSGNNGLRLQTGIGISTGKVFSGVLGSMRKKEFTSIGPEVNIAARLQSMAAAGEIIISDETYRRASACGGVAAEPLKPVHVKGVDRPIVVHKISVCE